MNWKPWLGLPHETGADPRDGKGVCCLKLIELLGDSPIDSSFLYELAYQERWEELKAYFLKHTEPCEPSLGAITLLQNPNGGLGVAIVVEDNYLLVPHHKRGLQAIPLRLTNIKEFYRIKA